MTTVVTTSTRPASTPVAPPRGSRPEGAFARLGRWAATHRRHVVLAWLVVIVALGVFAVKVETALSGAGWQANGSQSVQARQMVNQYFHGLSSTAIEVVVASDQPLDQGAGPAVVAAVERTLRADHRISTVIPPAPGETLSANGRVGVVIGGAAAGPNQMVRAADALQTPLAALGRDGVAVHVTGASALWADFNTANRSAMLRSEVLSWPVTLAILVVAFGSLVAAGLPLMLTMVGLLSAAGMLTILTHLTPVSIWAMNFALMFALALGIDYALFILSRYRAARFGHHLSTADAVAETIGSAGKAVFFSGLTVLVSLSTVLVVPSPAFRSMAIGIMLAVVFVLGATLTLLPAILGKLGGRVDALALPWVHGGEHRSRRFAAWAERLGRHPILFGVGALAALVAIASPIVGLRTAMPSIDVVPASSQVRQGYALVQKAFGPGAPGQLQIVTPVAEAAATVAVLRHDPGIAGVMPTMTAPRAPVALVQAVPTAQPSSRAVGTTIDRLRHDLPPGTLVGGAAAENHDLQSVLASRTPLVVGLVLVLGFALLLIALQAPLVAALGVLTNLLTAGAAFGVARLVFQNGDLHQLLGFTPQGFLDAWGPVFFFAMIFAISMDYTVFLLSSAKEHWERTGDPHEAMVGGLAHSGRVIFAAAAIMVAVFFTFALSGPLPPKEMGVVLGVAVLVDAFLVRLLLLPVLLRLTGRAAWWSPAWLRRVLPEVRFSHD